MKTSMNPFSFLRETIRFPFSRIQRTTLWQKVEDAFEVTFGMYKNYKGFGVPKHWGIFDYLTLGIHKFLVYIMMLEGRRLADWMRDHPVVKWIFSIFVVLPMIVIPFGCLCLARYVASALFTFLALPFIVLVHLVVGMALRQEAFEPILNQPKRPTLPEPDRYSPEMSALRDKARLSNKKLETFLPSSSLNEIRIALDSVRRELGGTFAEGLEYLNSSAVLKLLINGTEVDKDTPPPTMESFSPNQAPLHFEVRRSCWNYRYDNGQEAGRRYDTAGIFIEKEVQANVHSTDKELLSLLETAIKLNIGHVATRFEKNGTLDLVLSYLKTMQKPVQNFIPERLIPGDVVNDVIMRFI